MLRHRRFFKLAIAFSLVLIALGVFAWFFPQQVLTVDSGPVKADAIVVLGGGMTERPERAAELFKQGEAPEILVSGKGDCASNEKLLEKEGVPEKVITLECGSHTTRENAEFSIPLLRQMGAHRVIIVTSWYHSRRALACFEHYAPDLKFYSRPSYAGYLRGNENAEIGKAENRKQPGEVANQTSRAKDQGTTDDGRQRAESGGSAPHPTLSPVEAERVRAAQRAERKAQEGYVRSEYLKLLGYWVRYGVCPL
jgi:uncharacterized SAM-binding protein YcdF (DUF218 family)